jgi:hypothetical protein
MDLQAGQTIFDKLDIPYDTLRNFPNPIKPITDYYRQFLKPGEEVWWLDQEEPKSTGLIIKLWNNLPAEIRKHYMLKSMILFPEIFSNRPDKFNRLAIWLVNMEGVVCPNVRDIFTAGGKGSFNWKEFNFINIPRIILKMLESIDEIYEMMDLTDSETLKMYWECSFKSKFPVWIELVGQNINNLDLKSNLIAFLQKKGTLSFRL